jgi:uncharacterized protein
MSKGHVSILNLLILSGAGIVGFLSLYFSGVVKSDVITQLQTAATRNEYKAQCKLANHYDFGEGVAPDHHKALYWYEQCATHPKAEIHYKNQAAYNAGSLYQELMPTDPNAKAKAQAWFLKAAEMGHLKAMRQVAWMNDTDNMTPAQGKLAAHWYEKLANYHDMNATYRLAYLYQNAKGELQDYGKARQWFKVAAQDGNADALEYLGIQSTYAQGTTQSYKEAAEWFTKAAEAGSEQSLYNLGWLYENGGYGLQLNYNTARQWYLKSAQANNPDAQFALGKMYYYGRGGPVDEEKARYWLNRSAMLGDKGAISLAMKLQVQAIKTAVINQLIGQNN